MMQSGKFLRSAAALALATSISTNAFAANCGFQFAFERPDEGGTKKVKVFKGNPIPALGNRQPLLFITSLKVNTDGTKISYHQDDVTGRRCENNPSATPCAVNNIRNAFNDHRQPESDFTAVRNAGYPLPRTWQVLSPSIIEKNKTTNKPCVTADGYLVSMTADVAVDGGFNRSGDCDQSKWIDALTVPAIVLPKGSQFGQMNIDKRSIVVAFSRSASRRVVPGIVGDFGPVNEIGEATVAMNAALNGLAETDVPKHRRDVIARFQAGASAILLFPGNNLVLARPITRSRVTDAGTSALEKFGGAEKLYQCIRDEVDPDF
jgi:hypothetical protein